MKKYLSVKMLILLIFFTFSGVNAQQDLEKIKIGNFRIIHSKIMNSR